MRAVAAAAMIAGAALGCGSAAAAVRYESAFTPLRPAECRELRGATADAPSGSLHECPGRDGVRVILADDDLRSWLRLRFAGRETDLMDAVTGSYAPGVFPRIAAAQLEWRYRVDGARRVLVALIVRVTGRVDESSSRLRSHLLVVRVTPAATFCVIGTAAANQAARRLADSATTCS